jgi:[acyl-carrier-protein] S-malonyltransferase
MRPVAHYMSDLYKLACVFPGQGAQSLGMLGDLAAAFPIVRETFQEASDKLSTDLWSLIVSGPESSLNQTQNTQPVMLAAGVAVWRVWRAAGGKCPVVMAGHSLGEYTALVCADALDFQEAVLLVRERGRLMQEAVLEGEGAMAAILALEDAQVEDVCARAAHGQIVAAANYNTPGQVVIAGHVAAVTRAMALATEAGAKRVMRLAVSVPAHCSLMAPAAKAFAGQLETTPMQAPQITVLHNVDVQHHDDPSDIREMLARQLYSPVRWVETVQAFSARGARTAIELGPGRVLTGMNKRIDRSLLSLCVYDPLSLEQALAKCDATGNATG